MMRFTGGDQLDGFRGLVHESMMRNELSGGQGAYELSHAGTTNSGFSFGGNQMDLSVSSVRTKEFKDILQNAVDENGNPIFAASEIDPIVQTAAQKGNPNAFTAQEESKINTALSSDYGVDVINDLYLEELESRINHVDEMITTIDNPESRGVLASDEAKLMLVDFHNQFGLSIGGPMNRYLNGEAVTMNGQTLQVNGELHTTDIHSFIEHTKYGTNHPNDVTRRQANIESVIEDNPDFLNSGQSHFDHKNGLCLSEPIGPQPYSVEPNTCDENPEVIDRILNPSNNSQTSTNENTTNGQGINQTQTTGGQQVSTQQIDSRLADIQDEELQLAMNDLGPGELDSILIDSNNTLDVSNNQVDLDV